MVSARMTGGAVYWSQAKGMSETLLKQLSDAELHSGVTINAASGYIRVTASFTTSGGVCYTQLLAKSGSVKIGGSGLAGVAFGVHWLDFIISNPTTFRLELYASPIEFQAM